MSLDFATLFDKDLKGSKMDAADATDVIESRSKIAWLAEEAAKRAAAGEKPPQVVILAHHHFRDGELEVENRFGDKEDLGGTFVIVFAYTGKTPKCSHKKLHAREVVKKMAEEDPEIQIPAEVSMCIADRNSENGGTVLRYIQSLQVTA